VISPVTIGKNNGSIYEIKSNLIQFNEEYLVKTR
jgi:hypothetical protein